MRPIHAFTNRVATLRARDVLRVTHDGDSCLMAIANSYAEPFSTCFAEGSRFLLDRLEEAWCHHAARGSNRLATAWEEATIRFFERYPELDTHDPWTSNPRATLLAVQRDPGRVQAMWVGDHQLRHFRQGTLLYASRPDTLRASGGHDHLHLVARILDPSEPTPANRQDIRFTEGSEFLLLSGTLARHHPAPQALRNTALATLPAAKDTPFLAAIRWTEP